MDGICKTKCKITEKCSSNGSDKSCDGGICAQYGEGDYRCCNSIASGWFDEWCNGLSDGNGCKHNNQCNSGYCFENKCVTPVKSCPGWTCTVNGQYCADTFNNYRCDYPKWVQI